MPFTNRAAAGRELARRLTGLFGHDVLVVGLPRGGVVAAREVADALDAELDVLGVGKVGVPNRPELAIGAVGEGGVLVRNSAALRRFGITQAAFERAADHRRVELIRRAAAYRAVRPAAAIAGRTVVLVDDGIATGATARAAIQVLLARGAGRIVLAVPVAAEGTIDDLGRDIDQTVCLRRTVWLHAVGRSYHDFGPVTDAEVVAILEQHVAVLEAQP